MTKNDWYEAGDQIKRIVQDAVDTGDFSQIGGAISDVVNDTLDGLLGNETYRRNGSSDSQTYDNGQTYEGAGRGTYGANDQTYRGTSERVRRAYERAESREHQTYDQATGRTYQRMNGQSGQSSRAWSGTNARSSSGTCQPVATRRKVPGEFGSKVMKYIGFGLGALFGVSFGLAVLAAFATGNFFLLWDTAGSVGFLCICSLLLGMNGERRLGVSRRFRRYQEVIGSRTYCLIEELASGIGETTKYVKKDLKRMIRRGYFPVGYLDRKETLLITDQSTYQQYLKTEEEYEKRQNERAASEAATKAKAVGNAKKSAAGQGVSGQAAAQTASAGRADMTGSAKGQPAGTSDTAAKEKKPERSPEHQALLDEGWKYIRHIRDCNDRLPDAEITAKLNRLELVVTRIFREAEKNPDAVSDLRKMMSYYLPTTSKLLDAYCELDNQPIRGENIENTRHEIENALDTINTAFENLLNDLFEEQAWDISSDISVLNAMLAQEGLTGSAFGKMDASSKNAASKDAPPQGASAKDENS